MKGKLSSCTEVVSYFLWEYTRHTNALDLWYCAEDISFYLEEKGILSLGKINEIILLSKTNEDYIGFVRHIAYRIFLFTSDSDDIKNWFIAEKLLQNGEWLDAVLNVSKMYSEIRGGNYEIADSIRSEKLKKLLSS